MSKLSVTMACTPYDRVGPLLDGRVKPEGIDLNFIPMDVEETFWRQLRYGEFDCSELSLSSYTLARARGDDRFIAIPVFTSRFFRHSCVYINANKGIKTPQDLKGKIIGVPEYQMTAPLWIRGIFQHYYGVHPNEIHWCAGGMDTPSRPEKLKIDLPPDVDYRPISGNKTLNQMLEDGEIDAMFTARTPKPFLEGSPNVKRLFENYVEVEQDYYRQTGIFPIMHCIGFRRDFYEKHPWAAQSMLKAFQQAKDIVMENYKNTSALYTTLPWQVQTAESTRALMGDDYWPYGIARNRKALEAICQYSYEQGLSKKLMTIEELFAKECFDEYKI
ncbi:MAG: ABC transporter substrate-binding protein [Peptococcaceae bacterium]|nr:ABC transporter substrate-binding protein [Peptococcaceae bacterium]